MIRLFIKILLLLLVSCAQIPTPDERQKIADQLALEHRWEKKDIETPEFTLRVYLPRNVGNKTDLTIYIEGDGLAWVTRNRISSDPTPVNPVGLKLMSVDPCAAKAYLARPCQYIQSAKCTAEYWTSGRFSEAVVVAMNDAIDQLKKNFSSEKIELVGYSGGAAIAVLVAARRTDVAKIFTIAGNLDHQRFTEIHRVSPLTNSLNPAAFADKTSHIPQYHLFSQTDRVIPPDIAISYRENMSDDRSIQLIELTEPGHSGRWEKVWRKLISSHKCPD
jgi:hypothetical protein